MLRRGLLTAVLVGLGLSLVGTSAMAYDHHDHRHGRWEGRAYDPHEWVSHHWDHHYHDRAGRRRYWNGHFWVYLLPPPPHFGWHWDPYLGRYVP